MPTGCFRGGCLTGPQHAGAQLHGFLAYLMKCAVTGTPYTVFGYKGKQVRDNIHSARPGRAPSGPSTQSPRAGAVYNIGGGRALATARCSRRSRLSERDHRPRARLARCSDEARIGDHLWWISDLRRVPGRLPRLGATPTACARSLEEIVRGRRPSAASARRCHEALGRHPRPQRGGLHRGDACAGLAAALGRAGDRPRDRRRRRPLAPTAPAAIVREVARERIPAVRCVRCNHGPRRLRLRGARRPRGLRAATRSRSSWPTAPTTPRTWSAIVRAARGTGLRLRLRLALRARRARSIDYPRLKLVINRLANCGIRVLFRHALRRHDQRVQGSTAAR